MTRRIVQLLAVFGLLLFQSPIASAESVSLKLEDKIFKELYDAAVAAKETEVVYYQTGRTEEAQRLSEIWAANFPDISLKIVGKKAPELITQIEAERAAGQFRADVATHTQPYVAAIWKQKGFYQPYKTSSYDKLSPGYADADGAYYSSGVYLLPAAYSTRSHSDQSQLPKSFADFLDPKWKGKIILADPETAGNTRTFFLALFQSGQLDWSYLEKLAKQDVLFVRGNAEVVRGLASGEREVALTVSSFNVLVAKEKGQPIEFYGLEDGTLITEQPTGILDRAPHPHAAKLLLEVLTNAKGQWLLAAEAKGWPTHPDSPPIPGLPNLTSFKPLKIDLANLSDEKAAEAFLKKFAETFGRE